MVKRLELQVRQVGPWSVNSYGLVCPTTRRSVLIDPGAEPGKLAEMLTGSVPQAILVTHSHGDHIGALMEMRAALQVPVLGHPGLLDAGVALAADGRLGDGQRLAVGEHSVRILHAPGHTSDQICIVLEPEHRVVVGDTIFEGGPGKTWSPDGFRRTLKTLREIVLFWPDETICYPGHGPHFRLGDRRDVIETFLANDHGDFFGDATWDMPDRHG